MTGYLNVSTVFLNARGPLSHVSALDAMWISFYSIGLLVVSALLVMATRNWIKNSLFSFLLRLVAFSLFCIGSILMVLVVATWPS